MNGYVCTRAWFDFCFENPKLIKPMHHAIIHWIFEKANESEWSQEFQLPTVEACAILGITDRDTYQKGLKELIGFGAVQITQESQGRYIARWVTLENCPIYLPKKPVGNRVSDGVSTPVSNTVGSTTGTTVSATPNKKTIETLETFKTEETFKTIHDAERVIVENFPDPAFEEEKKESPSKVAPKVSPSLHAQVKELIESRNPGYYWQAKDGKATKALIQKIKFRWQNKHGSEATDQNVIDSLTWMLDRLPEWYRDKWDAAFIESKFESIVKQITEEQKNGKSDKQLRNDSMGGTGVSSRLERSFQLLAEHHATNTR